MKKLVILLAFALLSLVSPFSTSMAAAKCGSGNQVAGAVVGGLLGGLLGRKIDGGNNRTAGTVIGAVAGALAGSMIAKQLDDCEKDKMAEATVTAVNAPANAPPQTWSSDSRDANGTVTASAPVTLNDGRQCRTVTRVAYISGEEVRETPRMCRTPPSSDWQVA